MRRRVARVLRWLLFAVGLALVFYIPVSFFCRPHLDFGNDIGATALYVQSGALSYFSSVVPDPIVVESPAEFYFARVSTRDRKFVTALMPEYQTNAYAIQGVTIASIPLWLLAFICLAWPLTSFIVARKRKRGFPIEPKASDSASRLP